MSTVPTGGDPSPPRSPAWGRDRGGLPAFGREACLLTGWERGLRVRLEPWLAGTRALGVGVRCACLGWRRVEAVGRWG